MNTLHTLFAISMAAWFISEFFYKNKLKSSKDDKKDKDKSTLNILWLAIPFSIGTAVVCSYETHFPIVEENWIMYLGELFIILGIVVRYIIIRSLGKFFTVDVTIKEDHTIKREGFYKYMRHPSYAFSLLTSLGLGLYLNNWWSLILAFLPPFLAFAYRIKVEEKAFVEQFGDEYLEYRKNTKKLIPFIY
ncbi:methyltransferase family protein [Chryseobacterium sp. JK1]|uniref:methyltransferase family protein n=1 Tax=Chryseobacterium sp. JK1 TaxID=874294 RepID=UPI003D6893D9